MVQKYWDMHHRVVHKKRQSDPSNNPLTVLGLENKNVQKNTKGKIPGSII